MMRFMWGQRAASCPTSTAEIEKPTMNTLVRLPNAASVAVVCRSSRRKAPTDSNEPAKTVRSALSSVLYAVNRTSKNRAYRGSRHGASSATDGPPGSSMMTPGIGYSR